MHLLGTWRLNLNLNYAHPRSLSNCEDGQFLEVSFAFSIQLRDTDFAAVTQMISLVKEDSAEEKADILG